MQENEISGKIIDAAYLIHTALGPGLFESVYEVILVYEIEQRGLAYQRQYPILIRYKKLDLKDAFRADFIVESKVIVELKSVETISPVHKKQLLTYLRLTNCRLGVLINFNSELIRKGIARVANGL